MHAKQNPQCLAISVITKPARLTESLTVAVSLGLGLYFRSI